MPHALWTGSLGLGLVSIPVRPPSLTCSPDVRRSSCTATCGPTARSGSAAGAPASGLLGCWLEVCRREDFASLLAGYQSGEIDRVLRGRRLRGSRRGTCHRDMSARSICHRSTSSPPSSIRLAMWCCASFSASVPLTLGDPDECRDRFNHCGGHLVDCFQHPLFNDRFLHDTPLSRPAQHADVKLAHAMQSVNTHATLWSLKCPRANSSTSSTKSVCRFARFRLNELLDRLA